MGAAPSKGPPYPTTVGDERKPSVGPTIHAGPTHGCQTTSGLEASA